MVRVQDAQGNILAEVAGRAIPSSGEQLYNAIGVQVQVRLPHLRRHHPRPQPTPKPEPSQPPIVVVHVDPPAKPLDDGHEPVFHVHPVLAGLTGLAAVCLLCLLVGLGISRAKKS